MPLDSIQIFDAISRVTDSSGNPVPLGSVVFYEAGTTTPFTVYSDKDLSVSLGTTVYLDSGGYPVASQGSSTKVLIYTGTDPYKMIVKDADGATLITHDNIPGAPDLTSTETVTASTGTEIIAALNNGNSVLIPDEVATVTIPSADVKTFFSNMFRVEASDVCDVNIPAGTYTVPSGDIGRFGSLNSNLRILGAAPVETTISSVSSVSGTSGAYNVTLTLANATGIEVGHYLKIWNAWPLPHLSGDNSILLRSRPIANELAMPTAVIGNASVVSGQTYVVLTNPAGTSGLNLNSTISVGDLIHIKGQTRPVATRAFSNITMTIAAPGLITWASHGLPANAPVVFTTTGALPTGIVAGTVYYVRTIPTGSSFTVSATPGGATITTSGTQSGTHSAHSLTVTGAWTDTLASTRGYYTTRANSGTIGTGGLSTTSITGASSLFTTEANVGDLLLVNGECREITGVGGDTSLTVGENITITNGTSYSIITPAVLHEGAHLVTAVAGNNVTVTNTSRKAPPVNKVAGGEVMGIKTVLHNTGTGDGLVADQGAALRWINDLVLRGDGATTGSMGLALTNRFSEGATQIGTDSTISGGDGLCIVGWGYGAFLGNGCDAQLRQIALSGNTTFGAYVLEGSTINFRNSVASGNGNSGLQINAGCTFLGTEGRGIGNGADGWRFEVGADCYAEIPFFWGNTSMGLRSIGADIHINEAVCCCNGGSGYYQQAGDGDISRVFFACNDRDNVETYQATIEAAEVWSTGANADAGNGAGLKTIGGRIYAPNAALTGNNYGVYADEIAQVNVSSGNLGTNVQNSIYCSKRSRVDAEGANLGSNLLTATGGNAEIWIKSATNIGSYAPTFLNMRDIDRNMINGGSDFSQYLHPYNLIGNGNDIARMGPDTTFHNVRLTASVAGNALTVALKTDGNADASSADPLHFVFRNATATTGDFSIIRHEASLSTYVSSGSTLGTSNSTPFRLWVVAFDDSGAVKIGVVNVRSGTTVMPLVANAIRSSTAEGGAGAADSAQVVYTFPTAVTSKPMIVLGYMEWSSGLATAGTWTSGPTHIQMFGPSIALPGDVVQTQQNYTGAHIASMATQIPLDDSIPQNTEGVETMTQAITPTSTSNLLHIEHKGVYFSDTASRHMTAALFQGSTADALATGHHYASAQANTAVTLDIDWTMLAATTSSTTFKVRAGMNSTGNMSFNGTQASRMFGGSIASVLRVREIVA